MAMNIYGSDKYPSDHTRSLWVHDHLMKHVYPLIFRSFEEVNDTERQLQGIDLIGDGMLIDEKATEYKTERKHAYFFEMSLTNRHGRRKDGWFTDERKLTTHYMIVWYHIAEGRVDALEAMLLAREDVAYLIKKGVSKRSYGPYPEHSELRIIEDKWLNEIAVKHVKWTKERGVEYVRT